MAHDGQKEETDEWFSVLGGSNEKFIFPQSYDILDN